MTQTQWPVTTPSYRGIGARRYTVEDFAEPDPRTDALGWTCRVVTLAAIASALAAAGLGIPLAGIVLLGLGGCSVGVTAIYRGGLAWAWLPSRQGGVVAMVGGISVLLVAVISGIAGAL